MDTAIPVMRRALRVRGQVQGVGFRPFVYRLAHDLALSGRVLNDGAGVEIEVQGPDARLDEFRNRLEREAPRLARIDAVESRATAPCANEPGFVIAASGRGPVSTGVTPDSAPCADCIDEMFDPQDRRWRYAFTNCTNCGPRYTITAALPYDRPNTSMARFRQCPACQREYDDPLDRRFHAQPNACPVCGPRLTLLRPDGEPIAVEDPIAATLQLLRAGEIVAIKALGGFQLACDARNAAAVARLRERKAREEKPFAVMVANVASCAPLAFPDAAERALLESAERPIVLIAQGLAAAAALPGVAPGMTTLGLMLPAAPLHLLLFHEAAGHPAGTGWLQQANELVLVMTSANPGGEPLVIDNAEAVYRLGRIADALLVHDRDVLLRCDDSVVRAQDDRGAAFIRRARGYTPLPIRLADDGPSILAVGGYLKNTVCVTRAGEAFLSQHIGSLDNAPTCSALDETVDHLCDVLEITPQAVVHDLHPDFYSTRFAARFARTRAVPLVGAQHHHAHIAAVLAEHRVRGPVLGLALDGVGLGVDGTAWGGELLRVSGAQLRPARTSGAHRAARRRPCRARAMAHGGRSDATDGPWQRDRGPLRAAGRAHGAADAAAGPALPDDQQHGPLVRCCRGPARRARTPGLRRTGADAARRAGGAPRCSDRTEQWTSHRRRRARPFAAGTTPRGRNRSRARCRGLPRDADRSACRMVRHLRARAAARHRRLRRRVLQQPDPRVRPAAKAAASRASRYSRPAKRRRTTAASRSVRPGSLARCCPARLN